MCGIVGFVRGSNKPISKSHDIMKDLLFIDTLRGRSGTGIAGVDMKDGGRVDIFKRSLAAPDFLTTSMWERAEDLIPSY